MKCRNILTIHPVDLQLMNGSSKFTCALGAVIGPGASCWPAVCVDTDEPGRICVGLEGRIGGRMLGALGWMLAGISIPALALGA